MTEFWKYAIFLVVMALSENFTELLQSVVLIVSTISLAENDDSEASDRVFQIRHLLGSNGVQQELHCKSPKCDYVGKHQEDTVKTKI